MNDWRALTVKQPWAWAICHAGKDVENRSTAIPKTVKPEDDPVRVMLHAGKAWDKDPSGVMVNVTQMPVGPEIMHQGSWVGALRDIKARFDGLPNRCQPFGAVVAVVEFTGCHQEHVNRWTELGCCEGSRWAMFPEGDEKPMWHWEIGDVFVLPDPVPAKGSLGLWRPPVDVIEAVETQLPDHPLGEKT